MQTTVAVVPVGNGPISEPFEYVMRPLIGVGSAGHWPISGTLIVLPRGTPAILSILLIIKVFH